MSAARLWKAYYENDAAAFCAQLEGAIAGGRSNGSSRGGNTGAVVIGSPGTYLGSSPGVATKGKRGGAPGHGGGHGLTKADVNARDNTGQTILHHVVSSTAENAIVFATALIEHPLVDLYVQDYENGWTALHRAFYFGNITAARMMQERDAADALGKTTGQMHQTIGLIKVKDKEGLGPLDLYAATISDSTLRHAVADRVGDGNDSDDEVPGRNDNDGEEGEKARIPFVDIECDQLFNFGSNKNVSLGFGDEDDRQFPERINLRRPEHLLRKFYAEHLEEQDRKWTVHDPVYRSNKAKTSDLWVEDIPFLPKAKPMFIQDVQMSKLHSAVITSDPEANLYLCGHGQGGRLGLGDEQTRFHFVCVEGGALSGKRVVAVALGLNHTLALSEEGEIFSWGNNGFGQLGYSVSKAAQSEEDPISTTPRQIFGPLKRETVVGVAASPIHSVAHTGTSLFTFGKNEGQLGLVDSDARSLEIQTTPRKVAPSLFTSNIAAVSAMDKATVCLLQSREVWVFANYGYARVQFPLESFSNYFLKDSFLATSYDKEPNRIVKLTCGGDTICALSSRGEIYTLSIALRQDNQASASTTNPAKIRSAITQPQRIWSPKKSNMAARDVDVDADGSIILSSEEGSVWKRTKRAKIKDATASGNGDYRPKDYKFSRVPGLTRVLAVRASAHGAYAAVRRDCDVTRTQMVVEDATLWKDLSSMLSLRSVFKEGLDVEDDTVNRLWQPKRKPNELQHMRRKILESEDIEADLADLADQCLGDSSAKFDAIIKTSTSDVQIPVHRFVLAGRSRVIRRGFRNLCESRTFTIPDLAVSEIDDAGRFVVKFQGLDILTIIDLVIYLYTDSFIEFWQFTRGAAQMAFRYRQVRTELMKVATKLELGKLEPAARQMVQPRLCLDLDFEIAYRDPAFFLHGDIVIELDDGERRAHSALVCTRCPFFEGLFMGRAGGRWLASRETEDEVKVDLKHIKLKTFDLVLRHIYADSGAELFDEIVSIGVDDFLDAVMDVLSAANELMLDRLSQICQKVIGRFVNVRNVCGLLNAVAPSSVPEFKYAALDYLCLSLEAMLQGHHLNELEEDLLYELDDRIRENQLTCMPYAKSGYAESTLLQMHPELVDLLERSRQTKIDAVALRTKFHDIDSFAPGSYGEESSASPLQQKARRKSSTPKAEGSKPPLKNKTSSMFAMDEEMDGGAISPMHSPSLRPISSPRAVDQALSSSLRNGDLSTSQKVTAQASPNIIPQTITPEANTPTTPRSFAIDRTPGSAGQPWAVKSLSGAKMDMKDIMAQAASNRTSSLSQGLASSSASAADPMPNIGLPAPKMSQKDRKRMQQSANSSLQAQARPGPAPLPEKTTTSAWQAVPSPRTTPMLDTMNSPLKSDNPSTVSSSRSSSTPQLTMRQTVANPNPPQLPRQKTEIESKHPSIHANHSASDLIQGPPPISPVQNRSHQKQSASYTSPPPSNSKPIPQSIRHQPVPELVLGLSMSEIAAQQQFEKDIVKEAVAKRDLQDIQAEQEFQEWWDKESARVQEAEQKSASGSAPKGPRRSRGRGGGRGGEKGERSKGKGKVAESTGGG